MIFLFFLALSSAFWLFKALDEEYEQDFYIPIHLTGVPRNVVIITDLPKHIKVTLKDKGAMLINYKYAREFSSINIPFSEGDAYMGHVRKLSSEFKQQISKNLASSTKLVNMRPDTLEYYFNHGNKKRIPVRMVGHIQPGPSYSVSSLRFSPDSVTVYASHPLFNSINAAYIKPFYRRGITDSINTNVNISTIKGAKFEPSTVKLYATVDQMTEKSVMVPIQWVNFPATKALRTFPSKVKVTFQVGLSMYRRITAENFVLVVRYEDLLKSKNGKCNLQLKTKPRGASHVRIEPSEVDFLIEDN